MYPTTLKKAQERKKIECDPEIPYQITRPLHFFIGTELYLFHEVENRTDIGS